MAPAFREAKLGERLNEEATGATAALFGAGVRWAKNQPAIKPTARNVRAQSSRQLHTIANGFFPRLDLAHLRKLFRRCLRQCPLELEQFRKLGRSLNAIGGFFRQEEVDRLGQPVRNLGVQLAQWTMLCHRNLLENHERRRLPR